MTYRKEYYEIFDFIDRSLSRKLTNDQKHLLIVSEGDLQSCTYYHMRRFFKKKKFTKWHILNKLPMGERKTAKKYPDLVIVWMVEKKPKGNYADILIELKESINFKPETARNEIKKLQKMVDYHQASSGFFLYACRDKRENKKVKHTDKIMEEMVSKDWKNNLIPKTINIKGKKTYAADMAYFDEKIEILRKYRG